MCSDQRIIFYCNSHWLLAVVLNILYLVSNLCSLFFAFCSLLFDLFCLLSGTIWYLFFLCLPFSLSALYFCSPLFLGFSLLSALPCYKNCLPCWSFHSSVISPLCSVFFTYTYITSRALSHTVVCIQAHFVLWWLPYLE